MNLSLTIVFLLTAFGTIYARDSTASIAIMFSWQYHYQVPRLDTMAFRTALGDEMSVSTLRYYVGNLVLKSTTGTSYRKHGYYLVGKDAEGEGTWIIDSIPPGSYSSISFTLGVDSVDNVAGPQEGALDPLHGMYWTWATGYIFFKLEGISPASPQPKHLVEYHIGGFSAPSNNIQRVTLSLQRPLVVNTNQQQHIDVSFDVGKFIDAQGGIDFRTMSSVTDVLRAAPIAPRLKEAFHVR